MVYGEKIGEKVCLDESWVRNGDVYRIVRNKGGKGGKGGLVGMVGGVGRDGVRGMLGRVGEGKGVCVKSVSRDLC